MSIDPEISCPPTRTELSAHPDFFMSAGIPATCVRVYARRSGRGWRGRQEVAALFRHPAGGPVVLRVQQVETGQRDEALRAQCPLGHGLQSTGGDAAPPDVGRCPVADFGHTDGPHLHHHMADRCPVVHTGHHSEAEPRRGVPAGSLDSQPLPRLGFVGQRVSQPAAQRRIAMSRNQHRQVAQAPRPQPQDRGRPDLRYRQDDRHDRSSCPVEAARSQARTERRTRSIRAT